MALAAAQMMGKPAQQEMGDAVQEMFSRRAGLLVKMGARSCLEDCVTCEAVSEFRIAEVNRKQVEGHLVTETGRQSPELMFAAQRSGFCAQLCCREGRSLDMTVSTGRTGGGKPIVKYTKSTSCPAYCTIPLGDGGLDLPCCCCLLPEVRATTPDGLDLGSSARYVAGCTPCVPKVEYSERGRPVYLLKPETCCGGCCVAWSCCTREQSFGDMAPFYFHDPVSGLVYEGPYGGRDTPHIRKVVTRSKDFCFKTDDFAIFYPKGIDAQRKAGLLGLAFLLEFIAFERQQQQKAP